jgi:AraC-like DNA-binding protein
MASDRPTSFPGISVLDVPVTSRVRVRGWQHRFGPTSFPAGSHADIEVAWVLHGETRYALEDGIITVRSGQGIMVPARVEHATSVSPGVIAGSAWIRPELANEIAVSLGRRTSGSAVLLHDASEIARLGGVLTSEAGARRVGQLICVEALAEALVVAVLRATPALDERPSRDPRIAAALEVLETRYAEPLGVDDLAQAAGISRFHFSRLFRQECGMSPYQYLQRIRLARARELLAAGHAVTETAFSVGFGDLGRFARAFREQFGVAPSALAPRGERRRAG